MLLEDIINDIGRIESVLIITLVSYVIYAGKTFINYAGLTEFEKFFLPPHKRIIIKISWFSLITIIFSVYIYRIVFTHYEGLESIKLEEHLYYFLYILIIILLLFYLLMFFWNVFSILYKKKTEFFILIVSDEEKEKWYLKRYTKDIGLLIEDKENHKKIIQDWSNFTFYEKEIKKGGIYKKIEKNLGLYTKIHLGSIFLLGIALIFNINNELMVIIILMFFLFVVCIAVLLR